MMTCIMMTASICFFFFNDTATTEIYTLSLHDALPISKADEQARRIREAGGEVAEAHARLGRPDAEIVGLAEELGARLDRKSTRLNSSHANISYAVFCLKKKKRI